MFLFECARWSTLADTIRWLIRRAPLRDSASMLASEDPPDEAA
jgi:hypothetical protein